MKLGAEPKKVASLIGLMVVAIVLFFTNSTPSGPPQQVTTARTPAGVRLPSQQVADVPMGRPVPAAQTRQGSRQNRGLSDFKPSMKPKRPEDRPDPMTVDPTIRVDVLAKLQAVGVEGMHRSLFEFSQAPPPPAATAVAGAKGKQLVPSPIGPAPPPKQAVAATPPPPPPPPPIPLKFYGYVTPASSGNKRAFFLEGEDVHVVKEGDVVKRRYKIVRIGINSVVVEDTELKNQQTLPLEEQTG
ncbi:MAG: hypothetical protein ABI822_04665 [Bryobacteraceae bacterium]